MAVNAVNQEVISDSALYEPPQENSNVLISEDSQFSRPIVSYADVARKPTALSAPLRQAVVSALYADFEEKDRRARNVVISGLLHVPSTSDKVSVETLCQTEFSFSPNIVRCRRLGQIRPGRVQPVLVVLKSMEEAEFLIRNAKLLRQSNNPQVKSSVYINADLTNAEALTAYQHRCHRRASAIHGSTTVPGHTEINDVIKSVVINPAQLHMSSLSTHESNPESSATAPSSDSNRGIISNNIPVITSQHKDNTMLLENDVTEHVPGVAACQSSHNADATEFMLDSLPL